MEDIRQVRFLIPPFALFGSLLWGAIAAPSVHLLGLLKEMTSKEGTATVIGVAITGGLALVALGYLMSAISVFVLRFVFCLARQNYEAVVANETLDRLRQRLSFPRDVNRRETLYAVATYLYSRVPAGPQEWVKRRWTTFMVSVNSVVALSLSLPLGHFLGVTWEWVWVIPCAVLILILLVNACAAWRQTMQMVTFLSLLPVEI